MPCYRLTLEYEGSAFDGWQQQSHDRPTVQGSLQAAIAQVTGESVKVVGAGRTDSGVHAEAQVASLELATERDPDRLRLALNGVLPANVAVNRCELAPADFHARYAARGKHYRYQIWNGAQRSPLREARFHWVRSPLDLDAMRAGAALLVGRHDFKAFKAAGSDVRTTVRSLTRLDVDGEPRGEIQLQVEGEGFLRHMVRILAGTLVEVGIGRREASGLPAVLVGGDRRQAGRTAPARGLHLVRVLY